MLPVNNRKNRQNQKQKYSGRLDIATTCGEAIPRCIGFAKEKKMCFEPHLYNMGPFEVKGCLIRKCVSRQPWMSTGIGH